MKQGARHWKWLVALLACAACQPEPAETINANDFESPGQGTEPAPAWYTREQAYSGQGSCKLTPAMEFGPGFAAGWASIGSPAKLRLKSQVWLPDSRVHAALVVQVTVAGQPDPVFYQMMPIHEVVKRYNTWVPVHQTFTLPASLADDAEVKVYAWQWGERRTLYLDDLIIEKVR